MKKKDGTLSSLIIINLINLLLILSGNELSVIRWLLLLFEFFIIIISSEDKIIPLLFFLHPLSATYDKLGFTYLFNFSILILLIKLFIIYRPSLERKSTFLFLLIVLLEFILILKEGELDYRIISLGSWIASYLLLIFYSNKIDKINFKVVYKYFYIGFLLGALLGFTYPVMRWGILNIPTAYRFTGLLRDPNYYCIDALLLIFSANTYSKLTERNKYILIFPILCLGALSISKTFVILMVLGVVLISIINIKKIKVKQIFAGIAALSIIFVILYNMNFIDIFIEKFVYRTETTTLLTGRDDLYKYYINELLNNPFNLIFGNSMINYPYVLSVGSVDSFYTNFVAHNTFLDVVLSWGVIGTILYITLLYCIFKNSVFKGVVIKKRNDDFVILLITGLLALCVLSYLAVDFFAIIILYLLMLKTIFYEKKEKTDEIININNNTDI